LKNLAPTSYSDTKETLINVTLPGFSILEISLLQFLSS
jgi:hypothetical protein